MRIVPSNYLKITNTTFYNKNVKEDIKISALGDLHISRTVPEKVPEHLKHQLDAQQPDHICLLGDLFDSPEDLEDEIQAKRLLDFIKACTSIAPTLIVLGSHDFIDNREHKDCYNDDFWQEVARMNNVFLLNDKLYYAKDILFMGHFQKYAYWRSNEDRENLENLHQDLTNLKRLYMDLPKNRLKIALMHSPEFYKDERIVSMFQEYDLIMSGHYHEGCMPAILDDVVLGNRGIISPTREIFPKVSRGLLTLPTGTNLLISGGIIKIQHCAPRILQPLNYLCYQHMDVVAFTGDEELTLPEATRKRVYVGKKF